MNNLSDKRSDDHTAKRIDEEGSRVAGTDNFASEGEAALTKTVSSPDGDSNGSNKVSTSLDDE